MEKRFLQTAKLLQDGAWKGLIPELPKEPQVPSRIHYLIKKGKIELPIKERVEIIKQKRVLQALLKLLLVLYVKVLSSHDFVRAEEILFTYRSLKEVLLIDVFEAHKYPEEIDLNDETKEWLEQFFSLLPEDAQAAL